MACDGIVAARCSGALPARPVAEDGRALGAAGAAALAKNTGAAAGVVVAARALGGLLDGRAFALLPLDGVPLALLDVAPAFAGERLRGDAPRRGLGFLLLPPIVTTSWLVSC